MHIDYPAALGALGSGLSVIGMALGIWSRESGERATTSWRGRVGLGLMGVGVVTTFAGLAWAILE